MNPKLWLLAVAVLPLLMPHSSMAQTLWGMSSAGGSKGNGGNIFSLHTDGTGFQERYAFLADGSEPYGQRLLDYGDGFLYGVTGFGGTDHGVIFKMHPDGTAYQTIYAFVSATGNYPYTSVIKGLDGLLYGVTSSGGSSGKGAIYKISTTGAGYQVLHYFTGTDGQQATTDLMQLSNGDLYGATEQGGNSNNGVVFKIKPDGTGYQVLHQFAGTDGKQPISLIPVTVGRTTFIYGNTADGGTYRGILFRMYPDGSNYQVIMNFAGGMAGALVNIGIGLYGVSGTSNTDFNKQVFYYNTSTGSLQSLHQFIYSADNSSITANQPNGVIQANGILYGTTEQGGTYKKGALFRMNTDGSLYQQLYSYAAGTRFINLSYTGGQLYGLTANVLNDTSTNTVYRITVAGTAYQTLHHFASPDGYGPWGALTQAADGYLYGIAGHNESMQPGWVFRIKADGAGFFRQLSLASNKATTTGSLIQTPDGSFYGMNNESVYPGAGDILKFNNGSGYITSKYFHVFGFAPGMAYNPTGSLSRGSDGFLYGMTPLSGAHPGFVDKGNIFKISPAGLGYAIVHTFHQGDGASPNGSLIQAPDGFLYGMTENGGAQDWGEIFKVKPDGSSFQVLFQFGQGSAMYTGANGTHPKGSLLLAADGKLYGMAYGGGTAFSGTVFSINTSGIGFQVIHQFNYTDGALPNGSLIQAPDGWLYGMTDQGGINNLGTIFRLNVSGSVFQTLFDFNGLNGKYPKGDLLLVQPSSASIIGNDSLFNKKILAADNTVSVEILPNPVQEELTIHFKQTTKAEITVQLTDAAGMILKRERVPGTGRELYHRVQMNHLPAGIYIVRISAGGLQVTRKIIKQ